MKRATSASSSRLPPGFARGNGRRLGADGQLRSGGLAVGQLVAARPDDARLRLAYGEALLGDRQYAVACAELDKLKDKDLGYRDLGLPAARACMLKGDGDAAIAWLEASRNASCPPTSKPIPSLRRCRPVRIFGRCSSARVGFDASNGAGRDQPAKPLLQFSLPRCERIAGQQVEHGRCQHDERIAENDDDRAKVDVDEQDWIEERDRQGQEGQAQRCVPEPARVPHPFGDAPIRRRST